MSNPPPTFYQSAPSVAVGNGSNAKSVGNPAGADANPYLEYFGPPIRPGYTSTTNHGTVDRRNLHFAYMGENMFLGRTITGSIVGRVDNWYTTLALPYFETENINFTWTTYDFSDSIMDQTPDEGVSRLISSSVKSHQEKSVRRGQAFILTRDFAETAAGREAYYNNIRQLTNNMTITNNYEVMAAILRAHDNNAIKEMHGQIRAHERRERLRVERNRFGIAQKDERSLEALVEDMRAYLAQNGITANLLIVPPRMRMHLSMFSDYQSNYQQRGSAAVTTFDKGPEGITQIRGVRVVDSNPFPLQNGRRRVDLLGRDRDTGSFMVLPAGYDKIKFYDEENDNFVILKRSSLNSGNIVDLANQTPVPQPQLPAVSISSDIHQSKKQATIGANVESDLDKHSKIIRKLNDLNVNSSIYTNALQFATDRAEFVDKFGNWLNNVSSNFDTHKAAYTKLKAFKASTSDRASKVPKFIESLKELGVLGPDENLNINTDPVSSELDLSENSAWGGASSSSAHQDVLDVEAMVDTTAKRGTGFTAGGGNKDKTIIFLRPWIRHHMYSMVMMRGGLETGMLAYGHDNMMIGYDANQKRIIGHYTFHAKAIVKAPQNIYVAEDVMFGGYRGGNSSKFFDEADMKKLGNGDSSVLSRTDRPSILAFAVDATEVNVNEFSLHSANYFDTSARDGHFDGHKEITEFFGALYAGEGSDIISRFFAEQEHINHIVCRDYHAIYKDENERETNPDRVFKARTHLGDDLYSDVARVFSGLDTKLEKGREKM